MADEKSAENTILIKKYGNRRLYSTESSSYITLAELEDLVHSGVSIQVVDASTGEDITAQILTQILVEGGKAKNLPIKFLEKIIQQRSDFVETLVNMQSQNIEKTVEVAKQTQEEMMRMMQKMAQLGGMWNPFWNMQNPMQSNTQTQSTQNSNTSTTQAEKMAAMEKEIQELKEMMRSAKKNG